MSSDKHTSVSLSATDKTANVADNQLNFSNLHGGVVTHYHSAVNNGTHVHLLHFASFPHAASIPPVFQALLVLQDLEHQCLFPKQYSSPEDKWNQVITYLQERNGQKARAHHHIELTLQRHPLYVV